MRNSFALQNDTGAVIIHEAFLRCAPTIEPNGRDAENWSWWLNSNKGERVVCNTI